MVLYLVLFFSFIQLSFVFFFNNEFIYNCRLFLIFFSIISFFLSLFLYFNYNKLLEGFSSNSFFIFNDSYNIIFSFGIDSISSLFIILTILLKFLCLLYTWNQFRYCFKELLILLYSIEFLLINFFITTNFFFFRKYFISYVFNDW